MNLCGQSCPARSEILAMEISYYEMSYDDIPEVARMEAEYFSTPWSEAGIGHYMDAGNTIFIVAKHKNDKFEGNGRVVGYAAVMQVLDEADLVSIAVDKEYRQMGIAGEILDIVYDIAAGKGVEKLHLEVRESNLPAIALYERDGFVRDGLRKGFYKNPAEDALLYTKQLK